MRDKLHVSIWNIQGLSLYSLEAFLRDFNTKLPWQILCLQEFAYSKMFEDDFYDAREGHLIFCRPPIVGNRSCGLIFHHKIRHLVIRDIMRYYHRGVAAGLHWQGYNILVGTFHLTSNMKHGDYNTSIQMLRNFLEIKFDNNIRKSFGNIPGAPIDHKKAKIYLIFGNRCSMSGW